MRSQIIIFSMVSIMIFLAGCEPKPTSGIVGYSEGQQTGITPEDIPFVSIDGKQSTFSKVRQPIAIVVFSEAPGTVCCRLIPELVTLADRFKNDAITVAQISLPTSKCPHGPGCVEVCDINNAHIVSLCDKDRMAWKAYHKPKNNAVFLIDEYGKIVSTGNIENLQSIAKKATELEEKYQKSRMFSY